jgi:peptidoglycan hydrolase-like protein with peptidoglycan-binding domain
MSLALMQKLAPLQLKRLLAGNASADEDDVLNVKQQLNVLGHYEVPSYGMTRYPDSRLFDGITSFQREQGLTVDGYMQPDGETETRLNQIYLQETAAPQKTLVKFFGTLPQKDLPKPAKKSPLPSKIFPGGGKRG